MGEEYDELVAIQEQSVYGEEEPGEEGEEDYDFLSEEGEETEEEVPKTDPQEEADPHKKKAYRFIPGTCALCAETCFARNVLCGKCAKEYGKYATWPEWLKELSRSRDRERHRQEQVREGGGEPLASDILGEGHRVGIGPGSDDLDAYGTEEALDDSWVESCEDFLANPYED